MSSESNHISDGFRITELGPLPEDWQVVSLRDVFIETDRRVANPQDINADKFPVLSLTKNYGLMLQSERFGKRIALENVSDYKVVKSGEIVYNPYVIWEGAIHILDRFDYGLVSPVYPVLETNRERADPYFLDMMLRTPLAIAAYNRFAAGAVNRRRSIRRTDFMAIKIPLPSPPEQKSISRFLSTIQKAVEAQDKIISATRELKKSLMRHLFTYGLVLVSQAEQVSLKETEIGLVPESWQVVRLEIVSDIIMGQAPSSNTYNTEGLGLPFFQGKAEFGDIFPTPRKWCSAPAKIAEKDDVLLSVRAPIGYVNIAGERCCIGRGLAAIRANEKAEGKYLFYRLAFSKELLESKGTGTTFKEINKAVITSFAFPLPPLSEQKTISLSLSSVDNKIGVEEKRKASLQALFKTMLHQLMTGKVRVKDLEAMAA